MGSVDGPTNGSSVVPPPPPGFVPVSQAPPPPPGFVPAGGGQATQAPPETAAQMFARKDVAQAQNEAAATQQESADFHANLNELFEAAHDIRNGNVAKGTHRALGAVGKLLAPAALTVLPATAIAAPLATGGAIVGGVAGQKVGEYGATAVGANPDQAALAGDVGAMIGGGLGAKGGSSISKAVSGTQEQARTLYRSALKPPPTSIAGKAAKIQAGIETGLKENIPVTKGGLEKLYDFIDDLHEKVSAVYNANPEREVNPKAVANTLGETEHFFGEQANPQEDVSAVKQVRENYLAKHTEQRPYTPITYKEDEAGNISAMPGPRGSVSAITPTPAPQAATEKSRTYQMLRGKYGELKTAQVESEKALARGIKGQLDELFPEAKALNEKEGGGLDLEPLLVRAVQRIGNQNLLGLGTTLAGGLGKAVTGSNKVAAAAAVLKSVMDEPGIKSRIAIAMYRHGVSPAVIDARLAAFASGLASAAGTSSQGGNQETNQPPSPPTTPANQ